MPAPVLDRPATAASCARGVPVDALRVLHGPAVPALRGNFGPSPSTAGPALSAHLVGDVAGVLLGRRHGRIGDRPILAVSHLLAVSPLLTAVVSAACPAAALRLVRATRTADTGPGHRPFPATDALGR
ncbi:hypothetical protein [Streptomyces sp. NPDC003401]